jgi:hypothetical protein
MKLFGDFNPKGELVIVEAPSIDFTAVRQPAEQPEVFEDRIVASLRDLRVKASPPAETAASNNGACAMSLAEKADAEIESYVLDEIWSSRVHPIRLYCGRDHTGICFICAPDMGAAGLEWCRYPGEPESGFTHRAANDIRIARNMPPVSEPTAEDAEGPGGGQTAPWGRLLRPPAQCPKGARLRPPLSRFRKTAPLLLHPRARLGLVGIRRGEPRNEPRIWGMGSAKHGVNGPRVSRCSGRGLCAGETSLTMRPHSCDFCPNFQAKLMSVAKVCLARATALSQVFGRRGWSFGLGEAALLGCYSARLLP